VRAQITAPNMAKFSEILGGYSGGSCVVGDDGLGGDASISALFICIGGDDAMDNEIGVCLLVIF